MSEPNSTESPGILRALDQYWFGYGSPVTLGIFRILIGTLALVALLLLAPYWESWFGNRGFVPPWIGQTFFYPEMELWPDGPSIPRLNLLNGVGDPRIILPFYALVTLSALTTALGLWTRASTIALAIGLVSLHHRNSAMLHGGDTVLRVMALYLALSPCGKACSVDRLIGLWKGREPLEPEPVSLWPQRLIAYNLALIYFTTVWLKYFGPTWKNGTATWYPSRLKEFDRFPVPAFLNEPPMIAVTTYGTLLVEFALATLVFFRPFRNPIVIAGIAMHMYIEYSMNIPLFSYLMICTYVSYYQGEEFSRWAKRMGERLRRFAVVVYYPLGTRLAAGPAAFLQAVDPFGLVRYEHGTETTWQARSERGTLSPVLATWTRSIGAWVFAWIPRLWKRLLEDATEPVPEEAAPTAPVPAGTKRDKKVRKRG
jgi:hypothetical protein